MYSRFIEPIELRIVRVTAVALLAVVGACAPTEPDQSPLNVRAAVSAAIGSAEAVSLTVQLENVGSVVAYLPQCYLVERRVGGRWVADIGLSGACTSIPPEAVQPGASAERLVLLLRSRLPDSETTVLRVSFQAAGDDSYEPASVATVRTASVTIR